MRLKPNVKVSPKLTLGPPERRSLAPALKVRANPAEDIVQIVIIKERNGKFKVTVFGRTTVVRSTDNVSDYHMRELVAEAIRELVPA